MLLDMQAAQAVVRARLLERAAHDPGPWQVRIGSQTVDATRVKTPSSVRFLLYFPEPTDDDVAWLICGGQEVSSWDLSGRLPETGDFTLQWKLLIDQPEPVAV